MKLTTQANADQARAEATQRVATQLRIPLDEAQRRVTGLFASGILAAKAGPEKKLAISAFLSVPSTSYTVPE